MSVLGQKYMVDEERKKLNPHNEYGPKVWPLCAGATNICEFVTLIGRKIQIDVQSMQTWQSSVRATMELKKISIFHHELEPW